MITISCLILFIVVLYTQEKYYIYEQDNLRLPKIKKSRKNIIILLFISFCILYFFKEHNIFPDIDEYFDYFKSVSQIPLKLLLTKGQDLALYNFDKGWLIYNKVLSIIINHQYIIIYITSILFLISHFRLYKLYSVHICFSALIFTFTEFYMSCFILRQSLAVSICLFTIPYVIKRKLIPFLLLTFVAFFMHKTAIVWLPMYFLYHLKINKKTLLVFSTIIISIAFISQQIIFYAITYIGVSEVYSEVNEVNGIDGGNATSLFISLLVFIFVYCCIDIRKVKGVYRLMIVALVYLIMINLFIIGLDGAISRLGMYFIVSYSLLIPYACSKIKNIVIRNIASIGILICFYIMFYSSFKYGFLMSM